jgi:hypothetical protein
MDKSVGNPNIRRQRIQVVAQTVDRLLSALNALTFGAALLDRSVRVVLLNDSGRQMCNDNRGIRKRQHSLEAAWLPDRQPLVSLAERVCAWSPARHAQLLLLRNDKGNPVTVIFGHSLCATEAAYQADEGACAVLFFRSLNGQSRITNDALRGLFHMTKAEVSLVMTLYAGATLTDAGRDLGNSINASSCQLRATFGKTNARRQADLLPEPLSQCAPQLAK